MNTCGFYCAVYVYTCTHGRLRCSGMRSTPRQEHWDKHVCRINMCVY